MPTNRSTKNRLQLQQVDEQSTHLGGIRGARVVRFPDNAGPRLCRPSAHHRHTLDLRKHRTTGRDAQTAGRELADA